MKEERRLVWRVLQHWTEISQSGHFPRRDQIDPWVRGEDGANCLLIAVASPIELSHFVVVGVNLAIALCTTDTLLRTKNRQQNQKQPLDRKSPIQVRIHSPPAASHARTRTACNGYGDTIYGPAVEMSRAS
ncbi:MAG TPA: hypothetical protein VGH13_10265 [Xanthobacteraceae bacterium]|jgi:hypothetical protein